MNLLVLRLHSFILVFVLFDSDFAPWTVLTDLLTNPGEFTAGIALQDHTPLEQRETTLAGEEKEAFLRLVRKMLQWEPEKRSSARELLDDEWIRANT